MWNVAKFFAILVAGGIGLWAVATHPFEFGATKLTLMKAVVAATGFLIVIIVKKSWAEAEKKNRAK